MKMLRLALVALIASPALSAPVVPPVVFSAGGNPMQVQPVITVDTTGAYASGGGGSGGAVTQGTTPWVDNISQVGGSAITLGQKTTANSFPVTLSSDGTYATAANQATGNNTLTTINTTLGSPFQAGGSIGNTGFQSTGNVAGGATDSGNPVKAGAVYNSTLPTYATGQRTDLQSDVKGNLRVAMTASNAGGSDNIANTSIVCILSASATSGCFPLSVAGQVYDGTQWQRQRGDTVGTYTVSTPTASANNALTTATVAAATTDQLKASAGNVYSLNLVNSTTAGFAILYDAAAAPTSGTALTTSLIRYCFPVAASAGFDKVFQMPVAMTNGASLLFSTSCTTYTAVSPAPIMMAGQAK